MTRKHLVACLAMLATCAATAAAATIQVGPTRACKTVQAGYDAASSGDIIEIDSGTYTQSAGWVYVNGKNNLTFRGVGATRPVLDAGGSNLRSKGIFVIEIGTSGTVIENLEMKNARFNPDLAGSNAAGVRAQGTGLTLRNCYIHDCDDGVLGDVNGDFLFEYCEFNHNGQGDGQSHNMYIGNCNSFTLRYCYVHNTNVGHEVKTRAKTNYILYNRIASENGTGSRELQLANAGPSYVIGNLIQQGNNSQNAEIIAYGDEGSNPNLYLYVVNNTIVNERQNGATFIKNARSSSTAVIQNNIFAMTGNGNETILTGLGTQTSNWSTTNAGFVNQAGFDYHLTSASTGAINAGTAPGTGFNSYALAPVSQYVHPTGTEARPTSGTIDIGAYEYYVAQPNTAPTVNAGQDITVVYENVPVSLHAAGSDLDGDSLTYAWSQTAGQAVASPSGNTTTDYSFTIPMLASRSGGTMTFRVDVNDGRGGLANDSIDVTVYMAGDSNHDWFVNVGDLQLLVAAWGSQKTPQIGNWDANVDFNSDGSINVSELQTLVANWSRSL